VTSDEVIAKVFGILGPDAEDHRRKVERTIRLGLGYVSRTSKEEMASGRYGVVTDKQKKVLTRQRQRSADCKSTCAIPTWCGKIRRTMMLTALMHCLSGLAKPMRQTRKHRCGKNVTVPLIGPNMRPPRPQPRFARFAGCR
jgi:hypothetical protein